MPTRTISRPVEFAALHNQTDFVARSPLLEIEQPKAKHDDSQERPSQIARIEKFVLPCQVCGITGLHATRVYDDHEVNTCLIDPGNRHSWRVDYSVVGGKEYYRSIKEDIQQSVSLINELQGILNECGYTWGKAIKNRDQLKIEKIKRTLGFLRSVLDNTGNTLPTREADGVRVTTQIVEARQFQQTIDGRLYIGARLFTSAEDATRASQQVNAQFFLRPRLAILPANEYIDVDRYLLALPRDPNNNLEATFVTAARAWLENLPEIEYPQPLSPAVSIATEIEEPAEPEIEPRKPGRQRKSADEILRKGYRGFMIIEDHDRAYQVSRALNRDTGVHVRVEAVDPTAPIEARRYVLLAKDGTDQETIELLKEWAHEAAIQQAAPAIERYQTAGDPKAFTAMSFGTLYRGIAFADCAASAKVLGKRMRRELDLSVRSQRRPTAADPERHVLMVPEDTDTDTLQVIEAWLEEVAD